MIISSSNDFNYSLIEEDSRWSAIVHKVVEGHSCTFNIPAGPFI